MIIWFTGNSGAGKTTIARLAAKGGEGKVVWLDGDNVRRIWPDLGLSTEDRWENNLRVARLAKLIEDQGYDVLVSTICPFTELRRAVKLISGCKFVYVEGGMESTDEHPYDREETDGREEINN